MDRKIAKFLKKLKPFSDEERENLRKMAEFTVSADVPNEITLQAIKEAESGGMASFSSIDELMEDLND